VVYIEKYAALHNWRKDFKDKLKKKINNYVDQMYITRSERDRENMRAEIHVLAGFHKCAVERLRKSFPNITILKDIESIFQKIIENTKTGKISGNDVNRVQTNISDLDILVTTLLTRQIGAAIKSKAA